MGGAENCVGLWSLCGTGWDLREDGTWVGVGIRRKLRVGIGKGGGARV